MRAIDLFAGLGGNSEGAKQAGVTVVWAANHWESAVQIHAANHPGTGHACQDLHQADWTQVPTHDLLMACPACQGHTHARGKERPHHDAARSTAWAVVSALGYALAPMILDAADCGVPQHRRRLFIVGARSKHPVELKLAQFDHVPALSFVDFRTGKWTPIDKPGRSKNTLARIASGRTKHGQRFIAPYYGSGSGETGRCLSRPIETITTRDRWAVIDGERMRMLTADENRAAMSFPANYKLPDSHKLAVHMLGNAVPPPMTREVISALRKAAC